MPAARGRAVPYGRPGRRDAPDRARVLARLPDELGSGRIGCILTANLATEAVSRGESRADARDLAERALAGGRLFELPFHYAHAASALMLSGSFGAARAAWDDYVARATRRGDMLATAWGQAFRAGVHWRAGALSDALERAVAVLRDSEATFELARALFALGIAERGLRARELLAEALDLAERCSAPGLADRARAEIVQAGARPRRAARTGAAALTATEERVARMSAAGPSNREIAQALFVTEKTVEAHLSSVYRKLGIRARGELAAQLGV